MAKFNTGQSFTDGDTVTGAKLNNITSLLDIFSGVIADQTAISATVSTADLLLLADTDAGSSGAVNKVTVQKLLDDTLTNGTFTNANLAAFLTYGTATGNRTISTSATITTGTITTGVIPTGTFGTTTSTAATITTGLIPTLTAGTTTGTAGIFTSGTIATLNSTTGTIGNLSTTLAGDFTISQGTGTLGTSGVTLGTYGSVSAIPFLTVDAKGRVTAATTGTFSSTPADGSITPAKLSQPFTSGNAVTSTSGTAIDFTGIPSWVKRITVMLSDVSTNGVSLLRMQLGVGGVAKTTGYLGSSFAGISSALVVNTFSSGVDFGNISADGDRKHGNVIFTSVTGNTWSFTGMTSLSNTGRVSYVSGSVPLSGTLNMVRVTTVNATDTFDSGTINIMYEG